MKTLRFSLVSEGSSDRALLHPLDWLLRYHSQRLFLGQWADLRMLPSPPKIIVDKVRAAIELYPCDLLFVHRDSDREERSVREAEIRRHLAQLPTLPAVCVIPVRMLESWLLFDEGAIRAAAGNPNGRDELDLPVLRQVESVTHPKTVLHAALSRAGGRGFARRRGQSVDARVHRIAELIDDYSPLRQLPAFRALEADLVATLRDQGW